MRKRIAHVADCCLLRLRRATANERGVALFAVLLVLVGLSAIAAVGMIAANTETRVSTNNVAAVNAFYAADAGLMQYLATAGGADSVAGSTPGGGYTAVGTKLLDLGDGRSLYRIVSNGVSATSGTSSANRNISTLAILSFGSINVEAAFASGSGLHKNGGSGTIDGTDLATSGNPKCPGSPRSTVAGVKVPPGGYTQTGGQSVPEGNPDIDQADSGLDLLAQSGVDWDGIVNGGLIAPDYTIPPDSWPNFSSLPSDFWPVIYVTGDHVANASDDGRGTLIVRQDLQMNGSFQWDGMLLVGGTITSNGFQTIEGVTVSGLNILLGETVPTSDVGNGNKKFLYNSCNVVQASNAAFGGLSPVPGAWFEAM